MVDLQATTITVLRLSGEPSDLYWVIVGHKSKEIEQVYFHPDFDAITEAMKHLAL